MSGDKVLQYVEPFAEVGRNRSFDDRAIRLSHQSTHTSQLPDLGSGTSSAGISHHVDGIERFLLNFLTGCTLRCLCAELVHHRLCDLIICSGPDIDDLVIALTLGNETRGILLLNLFHLSLGFGQNAFLGLRNNQIVDTDRNAGDRCKTKAGVHQAISEYDGFLQTEQSITSVDDVRNRFLGHRTIDQVEAQAIR